jgi:hypothetical protein
MLTDVVNSQLQGSVDSWELFVRAFSLLWWIQGVWNASLRFPHPLLSQTYRAWASRRRPEPWVPVPKKRIRERDSLSLRARAGEKFFSFRVKIDRNCHSDILKARIQSILPSFQFRQSVTLNWRLLLINFDIFDHPAWSTVEYKAWTERDGWYRVNNTFARVNYTREEGSTIQLAMTVVAFYLVNKRFVNADYAIHDLACLKTAKKKKKNSILVFFKAEDQCN